jgi:hypothetical protein
MKICIITYDEYLNIPYIKKYETMLQKRNISYDIILWNRRDGIFDKQENHLIFNQYVSRSKWSKVIPFIKWRKFTLSILKQNKYDKLIILTTVPGILISNYILKHYEENYLLDIRDFTYENFHLYKKQVERLVTKSYITTLSSKGFYNWMKTSDKLSITHNITNYSQFNYVYKPFFQKNRVTIAFVGGIRYYDENIKIIQQLSNNSKILLKYVGKVHPKCDLQSYCIKNGITNVIFEPSYDNDQKPHIYQDIDLINAIYGYKTLEVSTALPNKLYDCIIYRKPIVVSKYTYLERLVNEYHLGVAIDIDKESIKESIDNYMISFNEEQFLAGCHNFLKIVISEEKELMEKIEEFFSIRV